jgi:hypothetical protein
MRARKAINGRTLIPFFFIYFVGLSVWMFAELVSETNRLSDTPFALQTQNFHGSVASRCAQLLFVEYLTLFTLPGMGAGLLTLLTAGLIGIARARNDPPTI